MRHLPIPHHLRLDPFACGKSVAHADRSGTPAFHSVCLERGPALSDIHWSPTAQQSLAVGDDLSNPLSSAARRHISFPTPFRLRDQ